MGSLLTVVKESVVALQAFFGLIKSISRQYNALAERVTTSPGLPNPTPTSSYWLHDPPYPHLDERPSDVPGEVDVVIIGSGITAASIARTLLLLHPSLTIAVLDARQICSGATGRNGGHIKVAPYHELDSLTKRLGRERAIAMVKFQMRHLDCLVGLCETESWHVAECRIVDTVDLYLEGFEDAKRKVRDLREWIPEVDVTAWDAEETRREFGVNERIEGAVSYRSGALFPYRFVTTIWDSLLKKFHDRLTLLPETAALGISTDSTYIVETTAKRIRAQHVVHATNAFAAELVPGLRGKLTAVLGHMTAQRPGQDFPDHAGGRSWSVIYEKGFEYVTQRPAREDGSQGDVILGGGLSRSKEEGLDMLGVCDDSRTDTFTLAYLCGIFGSVFPKWGRAVDALPVAWTGCLGFTGDRLPFVGLLDLDVTGRKLSGIGRPENGHSTDDDDDDDDNDGGRMAPAGEWISAGYSGSGMVFAWLCGVALAMMMLRRDQVEGVPGIPAGKLGAWFPRELLISKERLRKASLKNLLKEVI